MPDKRVLVAMSGGVDSSVAAALMLEQGYEVIGVTMNVWPSPVSAVEAEKYGGCCSLAAVEDARQVAHKLGIPHYVINFRDLFRETVIQDFLDEYQKGRTPNPCVRCNQHIKFEALLLKARHLGADYLATGHYARVIYDDEKQRYLLLRGIDHDKDQSYVLYMLTQKRLARVRFPIGHLKKEETRRIASRLQLSIAAKEESQEICFVPDENYPAFIRQYVPEADKSGPIYDKDGNILGRHKGIINYTIGQRKGLGITTPKPMYVIGINEAENALVVGTEADLYRRGLIASEINFIAFERLRGRRRVSAKIRYKAEEVPAVISAVDDTQVKVDFEKPQKAVTPGQVVAFYEGEMLIGGGVIEQAYNGTAL